MFQRFASALFGDEDPPSRGAGPGDDKEEEEEEEEEWILVNYLAEARCVNLPGSSAAPQEEEEEEDEEDLVMIPSLRASPIRYASCTSLNSTAGAEEEEEEDEEEEEEEEEEGGFQRLDACSMEESWFVTPPPCFTGRGSLLESSPLENLLIEHPSMSVYGPPRPRLDPRPPPAITSSITSSITSRGKKKGRRSLDGQRHRPEVAVVPRRSSLHSACYARAGLLQPWVGNPAQRTQQLSRNALRRLNLLRPTKPPQHLHQPSQRHLNF